MGHRSQQRQESSEQRQLCRKTSKHLNLHCVESLNYPVHVNPLQIHLQHIFIISSYGDALLAYVFNVVAGVQCSALSSFNNCQLEHRRSPSSAQLRTRNQRAVVRDLAGRTSTSTG